jgi:phage gp29-like protein
MSWFDRIPKPFGRAPGGPAIPADRKEPVVSTPEKQQAGPSASLISRHPYGGHPAAGLTPEKLAMVLRSSITGSPRLYLELAEDMEERYPQYASTLSTRKRAIKGMEISVEAAGDDQADKDEAELVREVVEGAAFRSSLLDIMDAIGKSFSATEIVWDTGARPWKPVAFKYRDPRFFEFDRVDPERLYLIGDSGLEELWPNSWIIHRAKAKSGLTIRGGLARQAAWLFFFQSFTLKDWAIFAEAYGQPMRLGKFDPGASDQDKRVLLEAVHSIGSDFAAIIPQAMTVEFIKAQISDSTDLYERRADWLDRQCSKIVLGQTGTTDSSNGSGYAQAKVHDEVRADLADSDAEQLADTLNEQLVPALINLNFAPRKRSGYPSIVIGRPEEEDVAAWVSNVSKVVPLGVPVTVEEAQKKIGITPPKDGEALLQPSRRQDRPTKPDQPPTDPAQDLTASAKPGELDAIDSAVEAILAEGGWRPMVTPIVTGLAEELAEVETLGEAKAVLRRRAEAMGVTAFNDMLARAAFAARISGEAEEDISDAG